MNFINSETKKKLNQVEVKAGDIIGDNFDQRHTAFIGRVFGKREDHLYLVTYSNITTANNPKSTYNHETKFLITKWVDIEITILERDNES